MTPVTSDSSASSEGTDLPGQLRAAAADVIIERGLGAFSLREVARRADVSHAAPGYHFGDMSGLLTSLAIEGLDTLHRETAAAAAEHVDPLDRLTAVGRAYVKVGREHPAHMEVVFRPDLIDVDHPDMHRCGAQAFGVVLAVVQAIADDRNPDLDVLTAARLCWSAMQGLVQIHPKLGVLDEAMGTSTRSLDDLVADFTRLIVDGIGSRP